MIRGIGTDIIEIERIEDNFKKYGERFLDRILTSAEKEYCAQHKFPSGTIAGRFAAKEAIAKALGTGFGEYLSWQDIEIINDNEGKPQVTLSPSASDTFKDPKLHLSISHCKSYAIAFAVWEEEYRQV